MKDPVVKYIFYSLVAIVVLLVWIVFNLPDMTNVASEVTHTDSVIVYHYDTTKHSSTKTNLQPINHYYYNDDPTVDTMAIVKLFFTKRSVNDIFSDSMIEIKTTDTLYENSIAFRNQSYKLKKPYQVTKTITETKEVHKYHTGLFVGPLVSFNQKNITGAGVSASFVAKHGSIWLGADFIQRDLLTGVSIKIGK